MKKRPAVLIIHGLGEGIEDNENFFNFIQSTHNFDVYMFTLPGSTRKNRIKRGKGYHEWLEVAEQNISKLEEEYEDIYIVGHSMGAVISCFLASLHNVKKLVLVAPAFGIFNFKQNVTDIKSMIRKKRKLSNDAKIFYQIVFSRFLSVPLHSYKNFILFTHILIPPLLLIIKNYFYLPFIIFLIVCIFISVVAISSAHLLSSEPNKLLIFYIFLIPHFML